MQRPDQLTGTTLGGWDPTAEDAAVPSHELAEIGPQELVNRLGRVERQPAAQERLDVGVVFLLRGTVGETPPPEPAQVAVELRPDVPQFVERRGKLLAEWKIEKPRQIEVENVEHLAPVRAAHPLDRPAAVSANGVRLAARESQGRHRREHAHGPVAARLGKADRDARHVDVAKRLEPRDHVVAHASNVVG